MEEWKPVVGYEELFEVSSCGNFRNCRNKKLLKQYLHCNGYYLIGTKIGGRKGKNKTFKVHREVAKSFVENPQQKPVVNHIDGIKINNCKENLEWVTYKENSVHAARLGLLRQPDQKDNQKLNSQEVDWVLKNCRPKSYQFGLRAIARKYSVDKSTISNILKNNGYKT